MIYGSAEAEGYQLKNGVETENGNGELVEPIIRFLTR
jgi:hypothetical protein